MFTLLSELTILMTIGKVRGEDPDWLTSGTQSENGQLVKVSAFPRSRIPPLIQEGLNVTCFQDGATCI